MCNCICWSNDSGEACCEHRYHEKLLIIICFYLTLNPERLFNGQWECKIKEFHSIRTTRLVSSGIVSSHSVAILNSWYRRNAQLKLHLSWTTWVEILYSCPASLEMLSPGDQSNDRLNGKIAAGWMDKDITELVERWSSSFVFQGFLSHRCSIPSLVVILIHCPQFLRPASGLKNLSVLTN